MPVCDKCGTGLPVGYEYCYKCGYPVRGLPDDEVREAGGPTAGPEPDESSDTWSAAPDHTDDQSASAPYALPGSAPARPEWPPASPPPGYQAPTYPAPFPQPGQPPAPPAQAGWAPGSFDAAGRPVALVAQGWPRRFLAFIIDYFTVSVPVGFVLVVAMAASGRLDLTRQASLNDLLRGQRTFFTAGQQTAVVLIMLAALFVYCVALEGAWGATLGKRALGLRVVREGDFGRCGWRASLVRNAFKVATLVLMPFGAIIPLVAMALDPALHRRVGDRVAHTVVVRAVVAPIPVWTPPPQQPWGGA